MSVEPRFRRMIPSDGLGNEYDSLNPQPVQIQASNSPSIDAFGRWRVSNPHTLFDSKNLFNDTDILDSAENLPLFYDNQETAGAGTSTSYDDNLSQQSLTVSADTAGTRVRQTKMRFNYQPGKSQLVILTFNLMGRIDNIVKREGLFDDNNGLFLELSDDIYVVQRSYATGTAVDTKVKQSEWNINKLDGTDENGIVIDFTKTQILYIDYEWLGVGRVRIGFVIGGLVYYVHEFNNANNLEVVYMQTPNLPLRSEISNTGTGVESSISQICSTVISEGGSQDLGALRYDSTAGVDIQATTAGTVYAVCALRLKSNYIGATVKIKSITMINKTSDDFEWMLIFNPTIASPVTFVDEPNSAVQFAVGEASSPSESTITNGIKVYGGLVKSGGGPGSITETIDNAVLLGSKIDGTPDEIYLCVRPFTNGADINGSIVWREIQ